MIERNADGTVKTVKGKPYKGEPSCERCGGNVVKDRCKSCGRVQQAKEPLS